MRLRYDERTSVQHEKHLAEETTATSNIYKLLAKNILKYGAIGVRLERLTAAERVRSVRHHEHLPHQRNPRLHTM